MRSFSIFRVRKICCVQDSVKTQLRGSIVVVARSSWTHASRLVLLKPSCSGSADWMSDGPYMFVPWDTFIHVLQNSQKLHPPAAATECSQMGFLLLMTILWVLRRLHERTPVWNPYDLVVCMKSGTPRSCMIAPCGRRALLKSLR